MRLMFAFSTVLTAAIFMGAGLGISWYVLSKRVAIAEDVERESDLKLFTALARKCGNECGPIREDLRGIMRIRIHLAKHISTYQVEKDVARLNVLINDASDFVGSDLDQMDQRGQSN